MKVLPGIEKDWLEWQKKEHIPEIMGSGRFREYRIYRLLDQEEEEGNTYVVQYFASNLEDYQKYIHENAPVLRQKAIDRWGDKFIAFRTVMEVVN